MATYNVDISFKALRSLGGSFANDDKLARSLAKGLVDMHIAIDPSTPRDNIKVITHCSLGPQHNWLYVGTGQTGSDYGHMRVVIDVSVGSKGAQEKQELLGQTMEFCKKTFEDKIMKIEFEIRINVVEESDMLREVCVRGRS
jgi:hypothetical protein